MSWIRVRSRGARVSRRFRQVAAAETKMIRRVVEAETEADMARRKQQLARLRKIKPF